MRSPLRSGHRALVSKTFESLRVGVDLALFLALVCISAYLLKHALRLQFNQLPAKGGCGRFKTRSINIAAVPQEKITKQYEHSAITYIPHIQHHLQNCWRHRLQVQLIFEQYNVRLCF